MKDILYTNLSTEQTEKQCLSLLAVDMGIRTGLALYSSREGLVWYRSHNFGCRSRLRRGIYTILHSLPYLRWVVIEGSRDMGKLWKKKAQSRGIGLKWIGSEIWRETLLPHPNVPANILKEEAINVARRVIQIFNLSPPKKLNHNAAEAILIGLWGIIEVGWVREKELLGGDKIEKLFNRGHQQKKYGENKILS